VQVLNDIRPWWGPEPGRVLSMVDLIANGTVPAEVAGALWWAMERGASAMSAAGPRLAGKTTLATALLGFLPDEARLYAVRGPYDPIDVPLEDGPLYLLVNELSDHTPWYVWGPAARRAFALLGQGARMVATLHADSAAEAVAVMRYETGASAEVIGRVTLVLVLRARWAGAGIERRLVEVSLLRPADGRVAVAPVAVPGADGRLSLAPPPGGIAALAAWADVDPETAQAEVDARTRFLNEQWRRGVHTWQDVTAAVRWFRRHARGGYAPA
jgi:hypothetical protein